MSGVYVTLPCPVTVMLGVGSDDGTVVDATAKPVPASITRVAKNFFMGHTTFRQHAAAK